MKKNITFESALKRLDEIIQLLGSGEAPLQESLKLYSESAELLAFCEKTLQEARLTLEEILPEEQS